MVDPVANEARTSAILLTGCFHVGTNFRSVDIETPTMLKEGERPRRQHRTQPEDISQLFASGVNAVELA